MSYSPSYCLLFGNNTQKTWDSLLSGRIAMQRTSAGIVSVQIGKLRVVWLVGSCSPTVCCTVCVHVLFIIVVVEWDSVCVQLRPRMGPLSAPRMVDEWIWNDSWMKFNSDSYSEYKRFECPFSSTNFTWNGCNWHRIHTVGNNFFLHVICEHSRMTSAYENVKQATEYRKILLQYGLQGDWRVDTAASFALLSRI